MMDDDLQHHMQLDDTVLDDVTVALLKESGVFCPSPLMPSMT